MNYRSEHRLRDILDAVDAIESHLTYGGLGRTIVYDAVRMRIIEIGEATKALPASLLASRSEIPWRDIAGARDHAAHRYFDTDRAFVNDIVTRDLQPLRLAVSAMLQELGAGGG